MQLQVAQDKAVVCLKENGQVLNHSSAVRWVKGMGKQSHMGR